MKSVFRQVLIGALIWSGVCGDASAGIRIAVFGDGLTSGYQLGPGDTYAAKLQKKLHDIGYTDVEVVNVSNAAETTATGLDRLSSVQVKHPDIVIVELGINDALRGIAISLINSNLSNIVGRLQEMNAEVVLFGVQVPVNLGVDYSSQFAEMYSTIADKYRVSLIPDIMEGVIGNSSLTRSDGFYPNAAGVDAIVENTYRAVDGALRSKWNQIQQQQYQQSTRPTQPAPIAAPTGQAPMPIGVPH